MEWKLKSIQIILHIEKILSQNYTLNIVIDSLQNETFSKDILTNITCYDFQIIENGQHFMITMSCLNEYFLQQYFPQYL